MKDPVRTPEQRRVLEEMKRSKDPLFRDACLAREDRVTVALIPREATETVEEDSMDGIRFDIARNVWITEKIAKYQSWMWTLRIRQFLDWNIPGLFHARDALKEQFPNQDAYFDSLKDEAVLDAPVTLQFSSVDGGDKPNTVSWQLPPDTRRLIVRSIEKGFDPAMPARETFAARHRKLASVLARYKGKPKLHKRNHWSLVNLANVGQTVEEMVGIDGILPNNDHLLSPEKLRTRYARAVNLKVRFVFNDRFELRILSDDEYWEIIRRFGFPPNHELLSGVRPIMAAGYLTLHTGRITAIEDDGLMIPGKLPAGLPPMQEVLEALEFKLDSESVARGLRVIDWEGFEEHATTEPCDDITPEAFRENLLVAAHHERPKMVAGFVRRQLKSEDPVGRTAKGLDGFRLINVGGRAVANGDLPKNAEWIDREIASCLVRKAAQ